ncbi:MAG: hypothetical protein ACRCTI_07400 [Beijerinckiaceae bacterium]
MNRVRMAAVAAAFAVVAPATAQAQLLEIGRAILGIPEAPKDPIDYRERAPLVVPPSQNLRPPAESTAPDQRRANWPQDPDVIARRQAAENARRPADFSAVTNREIGDTRRMTLQEIRAGRVAGAEVQRQPTNNITPDRQGVSTQMNVFGGLAALREMDRKDAASGRNSGDLGRDEPRREFLTDPPSGLRRPADNAPFRATREGRVGAREEPKPYDIFREGPNTR